MSLCITDSLAKRCYAKYSLRPITTKDYKSSLLLPSMSFLREGETISLNSYLLVEVLQEAQGKERWRWLLGLVLELRIPSKKNSSIALMDKIYMSVRTAETLLITAQSLDMSATRVQNAKKALIYAK